MMSKVIISSDRISCNATWLLCYTEKRPVSYNLLENNNSHLLEPSKENIRYLEYKTINPITRDFEEKSCFYLITNFSAN